jgi:GNAT superfamily N-acetyltransferase
MTSGTPVAPTEIRPAVAADRAGLRRLLGQLHSGGEAATATLPQVRQRAETLVAEAEGRVVGLAVVTHTDYGVQSYAVLEELVVDEPQRRRGVGRALIEQAATWAVDNGATVMFVSAVDDMAERFYRARGFRPCTGPWMYLTPGG